jgi:hypothetical protein
MSYVIAQPNGAKKPALYKTKLSGGKTLGVEPNNEMWSAQPIEIRHKEVLVNLGEDPPVGSCYKVWVEPVDTRFTFKGVGEVFCYIPKLSNTVKERLAKAFPAAFNRVRKLGPAIDWDLTVEIRNPKGIKNGTYRYKSNGTDILTYHHNEGQAPRVICKVVAHELGHGIWYRHMDAKDRSEWIEAYEKFVSVTTVTPIDIKRMLKDIRQISRLGDFIRDADAEEQAACNIYLGWLQKVHDLSKHEVQDLIESGSSVPVPDTHLHKSDVETPITLYSKKSAPEMFCEALSSYIVGDLNDKNFEKMLKRLSLENE